ncbi:unnamed protein product [Symbiodinium natans]|uniref:Kazal-like domain-containing protein n=1 Tax=Symbiodinium natans TaxID=878477 RepID=A0A812HYV4_9DINO|nr:unnamed protein product [Symbiodinium natans]
MFVYKVLAALLLAATAAAVHQPHGEERRQKLLRTGSKHIRRHRREASVDALGRVETSDSLDARRRKGHLVLAERAVPSPSPATKGDTKVTNDAKQESAAAKAETADGSGKDVSPFDESKPVSCHKEDNKTVCEQGGVPMKPWKCAEGQSICCNPRMKESYYLRCVARECYKVRDEA